MCLSHSAHLAVVCRIRVHALDEKSSGIAWWNTIGEHCDDWCWVGSYNSTYQLDSVLCMRSKLQQRKLSPLLVLDEADATLRTVDRTQVCTCMLDMLNVHDLVADFDHTRQAAARCKVLSAVCWSGTSTCPFDPAFLATRTHHAGDMSFVADHLHLCWPFLVHQLHHRCCSCS